MDLKSRLDQYFAFERKFGWSELIALAALLIAAWSSIRSGGGVEPPRIIVTGAHISKAGYDGREATYIAIRNVGTDPVIGLQFVFDVYYLTLKTKGATTAEQVALFLEPQYPYNIELKRSVAYVRLTTPLPAGEDISLMILGKPLFGVTVLTDFGNALYIRPTKLESNTG